MSRAGPNGDLFYDDVGKGEPLVFIPGFGGLGSFWNGQKRHFQDRFRVITVDHRGTGESARTRGAYSLQQMTDDVRAVLDAAGVKAAVLVGHSTGGAIAQMLAGTTPERVRGLVLSSTWCRTANYFRRVFEFRRALLERGETDLFHKAGIFFRYPPAYTEENDHEFEGGGAVDPQITISRIDAILQTDLTAHVARIQAPALVIAAEDDCLVPKYMSDEVARRVPGARYVVLDRGGHFCPKTRSDTFNAIVDDFITTRCKAELAPQ
jgi:aminoacrylate hydrolase